jgi:hypothetical protein
MPHLLRRRGDFRALDVREMFGRCVGAHRPATASDAGEE